MLKFVLVKALLALDNFEEPQLIDRVSFSFGEYDAFYMPPLEAQEAFDFCTEKGKAYLILQTCTIIRRTFATIQ